MDSSDSSFPRSHQMEGRGLRGAFFQMLLRTNAGSSTAGVAIPDTVAFEHGYPRWWYQYDSKSKEVRRSAGGKDLHAANIRDFFVSAAPRVRGKPIGIIASYVYLKEEPNDTGEVAVEYHTADSLHHFLLQTGDGKKRQGLLQSIVVPLELFYNVVSVMWSPGVSIVRRRSCKRMLTETRATALDRFVTFDGPEYHSSEVQCAAETKANVLGSCKRIAEHIQRSQHLRVSSMQLFFVIPRSGNPVLLWCGAFYIANPNNKMTTLPVPPTLMFSPAFAPPIAQDSPAAGVDIGEAGDDDDMDQTLRAADRTQYGIEDSMNSGHGIRRRPKGDRSTDGTHGGAAAGSPAAAAVKQRKARVDAATSIADGVYELWHRVSPEVQNEHEALLERERSAMLHISDVLYTAHSSFLDPAHVAAMAVSAEDSSTAGERVEVPRDLARCLGASEAVTELLARVGLEWQGSGQTHVLITAPKSRLQTAVKQHPVAKLIDDAESWLREFFDEKQRVLRLRSGAQVEAAVVRAVAFHFMQGMSPEEAISSSTTASST